MAGPFFKYETQTAKTPSGIYTYVKHQRDLMWYRSDSKVNMPPQPHTRITRDVWTVAERRTPGWAPVGPRTEPYATSEFDSELAQATNMAYAMLTSKLSGEYKAALGVTAASWGQTWDMVGKRAKQLRRLATLASRRHKPRGRPTRRGVRKGSSADTFLEYQFGWVPLIGDLWRAANEFADEIPYGFVRGSGRVVCVREDSESNFEQSAYGEARCTQSARFQVINPNIWLANQLGLVNPALVAWDLVPWSFVVNRFVNINALLSSVTDTVGLKQDFESVTKAVRTVQVCRVWNTYPTSHPGYAETTTVGQYGSKGRTVGAIEKPTLQFRLPGLSMTGALIDLSLATQQIMRLRG